LEFALDLLRQMVEINSFTSNRDGVNRLGRLTAEMFASTLGFVGEFVPSKNADFGDHLYLRCPHEAGQHLAFVSHLDTVFPAEEEQREDFRWRRDPVRIIGPGVCDIKGGTMLAWLILDTLKNCLPEVFAKCDWMVALDASEERSGIDFAQGVRQRLPRETTRAILVMECGADVPGKYLHAIARKGMANFTIHMTGRAGHAGTGFWKSTNAIVKLAGLLSSVADLADQARDLTVNIGTIHGGTVTNRVPHECVLEAEMRAHDPELLGATLQRIEQLVAQAPGATLQVTSTTSPWPAAQPSRGLLKIWQEMGQTLGKTIEPEIRAGLSDANHLWDHAPTLDGLGPVGGGAHCSQKEKGQEYALIQSFIERGLTTCLAINQLLTSSSQTRQP
jgi:glutamate carboxypeptidase